MAQDVLDRIDRREGKHRRDPTRRLPLAGAEGWAEARAELAARGRELGLPAAVPRHLGAAYGAEALAVLALIAADPALGTRLIADLPYLRAEVVHAARAELALTLDDVLARRTHLALEDRTRGTVAAADTVASLLAPELGWSAAEREGQIARYATLARALAGPLAARIATPGDAAPTPRAEVREA